MIPTFAQEYFGFIILVVFIGINYMKQQIKNKL